MTAADLMLEQTAGTGPGSDFRQAIQMQGWIRGDVPGHGSGGRTGGMQGTQRMMSGVDGQAEVGQDDQEETEEYERGRLPDPRVAHLLDILYLPSGRTQGTSRAVRRR